MPNNSTFALPTFSIILGVFAFLGVSSSAFSNDKLALTSIERQQVNPGGSRQLPFSFAKVIGRVSPAVVSIRTTGPSAAGRDRKLEIPLPFRRFFSEEFKQRFGDTNPGTKRPQAQTPKLRGVGSGFFVDPNGYVVTNNHVVEHAEKIEVILKGGRVFEAYLIGRDPKTDLALLKVSSSEKFPFVTFGNSAKAQVGDWVIALGNPFGLGHTATTGIISARGRDIGAGPYDDFLQIDAPINKGNSGGPTFNVQGKVIGVNTAIISPTGVSAGIGFAIPANMAKNVVSQLKERGTVSRGWLGIKVQRVTKDLALGLGLAKPQGALISAIDKNSPAELGGLTTGDVILAVNGIRFKKMRELPRLVASLTTGSNIPMLIYRAGSQINLMINVGEASNKVANTVRSNRQNTRSPWGVRLAIINDALRARFNFSAKAKGVAVLSVKQDSIAAKKGIRPGDIIQQVSGTNVKLPQDVFNLIDAHRTKTKVKYRKLALVLLRRAARVWYVALPV